MGACGVSFLAWRTTPARLCCSALELQLIKRGGAFPAAHSHPVQALAHGHRLLFSHQLPGALDLPLLRRPSLGEGQQPAWVTR